MKFRLTLLVVSFLLFSFAAFAQEGFDYGGISDLKGLTSVYISPQIDIKDRERIVKIIQKANLSELKIIENSESADILLVFGGDTDTVITGATFNRSGANVIRVPLENGTGMVFAQGKRLRLVLTLSNSQQSRMEKRPVTKFAQAFVKAYKEANGIK